MPAMIDGVYSASIDTDFVKLFLDTDSEDEVI